MKDEPISPIIIAAALVCPDIVPGITESSITLRPFVLKTLKLMI